MYGLNQSRSLDQIKHKFEERDTMPHTHGTYASARRRDVLVGVLTLLLPVAVILVTGALASGRRLM